ncbi:tRNA N6-adenosine threonylcarbamoyltransferase [Spirochaetota bacterium]|nr:tRNA N6-adenosine threonylcarbamoyltransferase [Spirochaetota bacterium]
MRILAIETSCDETSLALVDNGRTVVSMDTASQELYHRAFGGVVPEIAARRHLEVFYPTLKACLTKGVAASLSAEKTIQNASSSNKQHNYNHKEYNLKALSSHRDAYLTVLKNTIDAIAVTTHPGLIGSLFVGTNAAKSLAYLLEKPLIGVSHLKAHFYSLVMTGKITFPYLGLLVSGGHTILALVKTPLELEVLGSTLDDACGECFDKIARALELPYPGGAAIEELARTGDETYFTYPIFRPQQNKLSRYRYAFSYSGLKTAVIHNSPRYLTTPYHTDFNWDTLKPHIAASFQKAALTQLVEQTLAAARELGITQIGICGGVAANKYLKTLFNKAHLPKKKNNLAPANLTYVTPPLELCTDNAAMIGGIAYHYYLAGAVCENIFDLTPTAKSFKRDLVL